MLCTVRCREGTLLGCVPRSGCSSRMSERYARLISSASARGVCTQAHLSQGLLPSSSLLGPAFVHTASETAARKLQHAPGLASCRSLRLCTPQGCHPCCLPWCDACALCSYDARHVCLSHWVVRLSLTCWQRAGAQLTGGQGRILAVVGRGGRAAPGSTHWPHRSY